MHNRHKKGLIAISPLMVFIALYLLTGIFTGDFYLMPISVAFMLASVYGIALGGRKELKRHIDTFSKGAGSPDIMLMIWIFVLAGAFSESAKAMGAVNQAVELSLWLLPDNLVLGGLFVAACFISLSIGTSVGTIVALVPLAAGLSHTTGCPLPLMVAAATGGAFFGDNLSVISDTTIAATRSQGCRMADKFKVNLAIVLPAAIATFILYMCLGSQLHTPAQTHSVDWMKVLPYLTVIITAVAGLDVFAVLTLGIVLCGVVGIGCGAYTLTEWFKVMGKGVEGMGGLVIVTLLAGGLMQLIRVLGGVEYLLNILTRKVRGTRGAELSIAALVVAIDLCTANNTVAILATGPFAREISLKYGVDPRKSASLLDTFSCLAQSIIPYGAQLLMAGSLAALSPIDIIPYLYYPYIMGIVALACIALRLPRRYSLATPTGHKPGA